MATPEFDCLAKAQANPEMPRFVLLGDDPLAVDAVRSWAYEYVLMNGQDQKHASALRVAADMEAYQAK